jgi:hypothetical protein
MKFGRQVPADCVDRFFGTLPPILPPRRDGLLVTSQDSDSFFFCDFKVVTDFVSFDMPIFDPVPDGSGRNT